ncbi:MAG: hypothetical protein JWP17_78, partial [Solirubrobacterales bacterium]|nr:hypothetical protein [Solirubrobacterales bacterium]
PAQPSDPARPSRPAQPAGAAESDVHARTREALRRWSPTCPATHVPADEVDEVRIVAGWIAANDPPALALDPLPTERQLATFARG